MSPTDSTPQCLERYATNYHAWTRSTAPADPTTIDTITALLSQTRPGLALDSIYHKPPQLPVFRRKLGVVEGGFAVEAERRGGLADMVTLLTVEVGVGRGCEDDEERERVVAEKIVAAWAALRVLHPLVGARWVEGGDVGEFEVSCWEDGNNDNENEDDDEDGERGRDFDFGPGIRTAELLSVSPDNLEFLTADDVDLDLDVTDDAIINALSNCRRVVQAHRSLSKLLVLPCEHNHHHHHHHKGAMAVRMALVSAHCTTDGLATASNWIPDLLKLLNTPNAELFSLVRENGGAAAVGARLPIAQEDLYGKVSGTAARRRWFWAIARVLRMVRKKMNVQQGFENPLKRRSGAVVPTEDEVLEEMMAGNAYANAVPWTESDFDEAQGERVTGLPSMLTGRVRVRLSARATARLIGIARAVGATVGAACFALIALGMMDLETFLRPNNHDDEGDGDEERQPWVGGFPINARPFLQEGQYVSSSAPDSCVLAFSDGISLPFLDSRHGKSVEKRLRLLSASASRQLKTYQKRKPKTDAGGRRSTRADVILNDPQLTMAWNYMDTLEKMEKKLPEDKRNGYEPNGELGIRMTPIKAGRMTCCVSSLGSIDAAMRCRPLGEGEVEDDKEDETDGDETRMRFRDIRLGVRARDGEFLVLCWGWGGHMFFEASYDAGVIGREDAERWKEVMEGLLGEE